MGGRQAILVSGLLSLLLAMRRYQDVRVGARRPHTRLLVSVIFAVVPPAYRFWTYPRQSAFGESHGRPVLTEWSLVANKICTMVCVVLQHRFPSRAPIFRAIALLVTGTVLIWRLRAVRVAQSGSAPDSSKRGM